MSKTSQSKTAPTFPSAVETYLDRVTDPYALALTLDTEPKYEAQYETLFHQGFDDVAPLGVAAVRKLLDDIDEAYLIEACARRAGFVLGFEYARRLLAGPAWGAR